MTIDEQDTVAVLIKGTSFLDSERPLPTLINNNYLRCERKGNWPHYLQPCAPILPWISAYDHHVCPMGSSLPDGNGKMCRKQHLGYIMDFVADNLAAKGSFNSVSMDPAFQ